MHLFQDVNTRLLGVNTWDSFSAVLALAQKQHPKPDMMLLTGDLAQDESMQAYQHLTQSLGVYQCPKYGIPGNHDNESYLIEVFHEHHMQGNRQIIIDQWNIILLNTQEVGEVEGLLSDEQLNFLDHCLGEYPEHHTLIFMHHPPVKVGSAWLDRLMLSNAEAFWKVLDPFHHVKGIICGHVHQESFTEKKGIKIYTSPSTCFQFARNQDKFGVEPLLPGYRMVWIDQNGSFETKVFRLKDFDLSLDMSSGGY